MCVFLNRNSLQTISTVSSLHRLEPPGDVLCFLTGKEEIDRVVQMLNERAAKWKGYDDLSLVALPL
jgi:ATP-dependent RNA helicase DDX35